MKRWSIAGGFDSSFEAFYSRLHQRRERQNSITDQWNKQIDQQHDYFDSDQRNTAVGNYSLSNKTKTIVDNNSSSDQRHRTVDNYSGPYKPRSESEQLKSQRRQSSGSCYQDHFVQHRQSDTSTKYSNNSVESEVNSVFWDNPLDLHGGDNKVTI